MGSLIAVSHLGGKRPSRETSNRERDGKGVGGVGVRAWCLCAMLLQDLIAQADAADQGAGSGVASDLQAEEVEAGPGHCAGVAATVPSELVVAGHACGVSQRAD